MREHTEERREEDKRVGADRYNHGLRNCVKNEDYMQMFVCAQLVMHHTVQVSALRFCRGPSSKAIRLHRG
jgi:hypothetical protein